MTYEPLLKAKNPAVFYLASRKIVILRMHLRMLNSSVAPMELNQKIVPEERQHCNKAYQYDKKLRRCDTYFPEGLQILRMRGCDWLVLIASRAKTCRLFQS
ncbi:MAG: hypothetical protein CMC96_08790 [Flavobacteriales bacterium]|nr:hypothetical protein [Flavobacteriales bacterium]|tara:strand:- start:18011 stop:18313 length:303 start_codon:yes stop_codon:yes gene_type:complete